MINAKMSVNEWIEYARDMAATSEDGYQWEALYRAVEAAEDDRLDREASARYGY